VIVLFDANVLISGLTTSQICQEIIETVIREHEPLTSPVIQAEVERIIRKKFPRHKAALFAVQEYGNHAATVDPPPLSKPVCHDPDDDWVLSAAVEGNAEVLVTGDKDLLVLKKHKGIPIITPRGFLEMVSGQ